MTWRFCRLVVWRFLGDGCLCRIMEWSGSVLVCADGGEEADGGQDNQLSGFFLGRGSG